MRPQNPTNPHTVFFIRVGGPFLLVEEMVEELETKWEKPADAYWEYDFYVAKFGDPQTNTEGHRVVMRNGKKFVCVCQACFRCTNKAVPAKVIKSNVTCRMAFDAFVCFRRLSPWTRSRIAPSG